MTIQRIYIPTHKGDLRLTAICAASIRYWYPEIPILLIKDYSHGAFDTSEIERLCNASIFQTTKREFGWGFAKLEPLFEPAGGRFLVVDSDTVFTGPVLDTLNQCDTDFVVDDETQPAHEIKRLYFDLEYLRKIDPEFKFSGKTFNSGQWVGTPGLVSRKDFCEVLHWGNPPELKDPSFFMPGDQGILNYVLSKLAQQGTLSLGRIPLMLWAVRDIEQLDLEQLKDNSPYRKIIHWAGVNKQRLGAMPRADILRFFEQCYFSSMPLGSLKRQLRSSKNYVIGQTQRAVHKAASLARVA